jgi:hypothetical protein
MLQIKIFKCWGSWFIFISQLFPQILGHQGLQFLRIGTRAQEQCPREFFKKLCCWIYTTLELQSTLNIIILTKILYMNTAHAN